MADVEQPDDPAQPLAPQRMLQQTPKRGALRLARARVAIPRQVEKVVCPVDQEDVQRARLARRPRRLRDASSTSALSSDDLPTLDRPMNATSGSGGSRTTSARGTTDEAQDARPSTFR